MENEKIALTTKLRDAEAKLADAKTKLINTEFSNFESKLRDSNDKWLWTWIQRFAVVISILMLIMGAALWLLIRSLIEDRVEKSLDGFKEGIAQVDILKNQLEEAVGQVSILQDQIRILEKEHAASVLEDILHLYLPVEQEKTKPIPERALLDLFVDKTRSLRFKYKAGEVLVSRKSAQLVSPALEFLNSVIDSDLDWKDDFFPESHLRNLVIYLGHIHTQEVYEELGKLLERLLSTEDYELKGVLLTGTAFSLAQVSGELNKSDSLPILVKVIPHLKINQQNRTSLIDLAKLFDRFDSPEAIKEILRPGIRSKMPEIVPECLALLQKHDPDFVEQWQAEKETANTQNEESE